MDRSLNSSKKEALLSFYNSFSDVLNTELCETLMDVRFLLHTVVDFIRSGKLEFSDHTNFGFRETVEFLKNIRPPLPEFFTTYLNCSLAETNDVLEIAKILLALFYVFRLERRKEMVNHTENLSSEHNHELAAMIDQLQNEEGCDDAGKGDVLAWILARRFLSPSSATSDSSSLTRSPLTDLQNNSLRYIRRESTPSFMASPKPRDVFGIDSGAKTPINSIARVVRSPRGAQVERKWQQDRRIDELERLVKTLRIEYDEKANLENELREMNVQMDRLRRECALSSRNAAEVERLKAELSGERANANTQYKRLDILSNDVDRLIVVRAELIQERDVLLERVDRLEERNNILEESLATTRKNLLDERSIGEFTQKKLLETERELFAWQSKYQKLCDAHQEDVQLKTRNAELIISQREENFQKQLETAHAVQEQYLKDMSQLKSELEEARLQTREQTDAKSDLEELRFRFAVLEEALADATDSIGQLQSQNAEFVVQNEKLRIRADEIESLMNELRVENNALKDRIECDQMMVQLYRPCQQLSLEPLSKTTLAVATGAMDDDFGEWPYSTPRTEFEKDEHNHVLVSQEPGPSTVDIFHTMEADLLGQLSIDDKEEQCKIVERSPVESRHSLGTSSSVTFITACNSTGTRLHCVGSQTDNIKIQEKIGKLKRRSSMAKAVNYAKKAANYVFHHHGSKTSLNNHCEASGFSSRHSSIRSISSAALLSSTIPEKIGDESARPRSLKLDFDTLCEDVEDEKLKFLQETPKCAPKAATKSKKQKSKKF